MLILKNIVTLVDIWNTPINNNYQIYKIVFEIFVKDGVINASMFSLPLDYVLFVTFSVCGLEEYRYLHFQNAVTEM